MNERSAYSVKETKEVLDFVFTTVKAYQDAMADGKIGLEDIAQLIPVLMKAGPAFADIQLIPAELADLSEDEAKDILTFMAQKLDTLVEDPQLKVKIEKGLKVALSLAEFLAVL